MSPENSAEECAEDRLDEVSCHFGPFLGLRLFPLARDQSHFDRRITSSLQGRPDCRKLQPEGNRATQKRMLLYKNAAVHPVALWLAGGTKLAVLTFINCTVQAVRALLGSLDSAYS